MNACVYAVYVVYVVYVCICLRGVSKRRGKERSSKLKRRGMKNKFEFVLLRFYRSIFLAHSFLFSKRDMDTSEWVRERGREGEEEEEGEGEGAGDGC